MNGLFQTISRMGIFMICAQAVIHFRPEESYEKYLRLLVSAMVLIQLFLPVGRLLFHGDGGELARKSEEFLGQLEAEISAAESRACESEALLEQMTLEEIRRRVEEQASEEAAGAGERASGEAAGAGERASGEAAGAEVRFPVEEPGVNEQVWGEAITGAANLEGGLDRTDEADGANGTNRVEGTGGIEVEEIRVSLQADSPE